MAEIGFKGTTNYDIKAGVFEQMWGSFLNCEVLDTVAAKSQALHLINNLLPYIRVDINQLSLSIISTSDRSIKVSFNQKIDSLAIEPR